jgi:hypothetical protein
MRKLVLFIFVFFISQFALAQTPRLEVFGGYSFLHSPKENFNGWNTSATFNVYRCIGITADFDGHYRSQTTTFPGVGTIIGRTRAYSFSFGPGVSLRNKSRLTPFARFLIGAKRFTFDNTVQGVPGLGSGDSVNFLTVITGGGLDVALNSRLSIRPVQFDYQTVDFNGYWGNSVRYSAGIVFRWGEKK